MWLYCSNIPKIHFVLEKLQDPKSAKIFKVEVGGKFALNLIDCDIDTLAGNIKRCYCQHPGSARASKEEATAMGHEQHPRSL